MPYIGAAFRTTRQREEEIELVILVTPELAAGLDPCEVPKCLPGMHTDIPNDCEMMIKGYIEVPTKGPCGPNGCGPNGCGPNPGINPATFYDGAPAQPGAPGPGYEVIPPGTQNAGTASMRPNGSIRRSTAPAGAMRTASNAGNLLPTTANSVNRYNPTVPQRPAATGGAKSTTPPSGFIGPVGYDVKN
jgi:pilus assembly protein CpaC